MKKIGIMGGTFDPIHFGHLFIGKQAQEFFLLDQVLFMPSGNSYMKTGVSKKEHRIAMTKLAIESTPEFIFSDLETLRDEDTYTYKTLELLKKENPDTQYYFIVGGDTLFSMEKWKFPEKIFKLCSILVVERNEHIPEKLKLYMDTLKQKYHCEIHILKTDPIDISSTKIRDSIKKGLSIKKMVPSAVETYILDHHLYQ